MQSKHLSDVTDHGALSCLVCGYAKPFAHGKTSLRLIKAFRLIAAHWQISSLYAGLDKLRFHGGACCNNAGIQLCKAISFGQNEKSAYLTVNICTDCYETFEPTGLLDGTLIRLPELVIAKEDSEYIQALTELNDHWKKLMSEGM